MYIQLTNRIVTKNRKIMFYVSTNSIKVILNIYSHHSVANHVCIAITEYLPFRDKHYITLEESQ
jgi:hypothetical protein